MFFVKKMPCVNLYRFFNTKSIQNYFIHTVTLKRLSSNFKRGGFVAKSDQFSEILNSYVCNRVKLSSSEWQTITQQLTKNCKNVNKNNVDALILGVCKGPDHLELAKSYIKHLETNDKHPNDATLGKLLRVYNAAYHNRVGAKSLTREEQKEILKICDGLRSKHAILDASSCENIIYGLVATDEWRDSLSLLEMMKISRSMPSLAAYTEIIIKAFESNDLHLGWQLMHEMLEQGKQPKCEIFLTLINTILTKNYNHFYNEMENIFVFLETYNILITEKVVSAFQDIALKHPNLLVAEMSNLTCHGKCSSCGLYMKNVTISREEFDKLQNSFLNKVLIRNDVFQKSTPVEVRQFCDYIDSKGPFDCVIDGLNVAYSMGSKKPPQAIANLLESVVKYFQNRNKYVLVLGRKHMNNWPKKVMKYIKDNAAVFLANDLSEDDPFLLYATLKSGQCTDFFSRDLMRQHAFLLGPELKIIFRKWQQEHQYSLVTQTASGKIIIKEPIRHLICAHRIKDIWHIPYKKEFSQHMSDCFEKPKTWLCIKILK